jgi:putative zinc finger/helix-turn-helix YgiT family protein
MGTAPWKCMHCRQRAVSPVTLASHATEMEHDGRKYLVELTDFPVLKCQNCGELVLDEEANDRLFSALRSAAGLLAPAEIRRQRETLGLKQRELASLLQISESTLSRWETGAQMQQRCMDKFLRGFFAVEQLRQFLGMAEPVAADIHEQSPVPSAAARDRLVPAQPTS